jgi:hypothetical protein
MNWAVGYDSSWHRDIGYGVPAWCDHPKCRAKIDRGLSYVCGGEAYGGDKGCGLYFCPKHGGGYLCPRCSNYKPPYKHPKPDHTLWIIHKLTHASWARWRKEHPEETLELRKAVGAVDPQACSTGTPSTRDKASS